MTPQLSVPPANPRRLDEILQGVSRLRPLPTSASRILKALENPSTTAGIVADLIALDQALTAFVLRVANSASMGYSATCGSVHDAVMRLGFRQVRSLTLSTIASGPLSTRLAGYRLGDKELWYHSVAVASAAHWLAGIFRYPEPEEAYVAGLLHDVGKLVLDQFVLADYQEMTEIMRSRQMHLWQVEETLFGIDHAAVGGLMANRWQFPDSLAAAIRFHHTPSLAKTEKGLAAMVNLANALTPTGEDDDLSALDGRVIHPDTMQILWLDEKTLERLSNRLEEAMFTYQSRMPTN